jgi:hypothetical protein
MERLTDKIGNTNCVKGCGSNCKYGFQYCSKEDWENCETIADVIDKLADYEDLEEQGRLLKLPCKVGDTVYVKLASYCEEKYAEASENDDTKNKVTSLEIIVRMIDNKPYYEIKYKKVGEDYYHVGYSSYNLDNVLKWRDECFELVYVKATNADRIRNMSDEELACLIEKIKMCGGLIETERSSYECKGCKDGYCDDNVRQWLQSEAE